MLDFMELRRGEDVLLDSAAHCILTGRKNGENILLCLI